jgi:hypothetical protein
MHAFPTRPFAYDTDAAVGTTGTAFALPVTTHTKVVRVSGAAAVLVGLGDAASPPAAAETNTSYQATGTQDYVLNGDRSNPVYVYVYTLSSTTAVFVSFLG